MHILAVFKEWGKWLDYLGKIEIMKGDHSNAMNIPLARKMAMLQCQRNP